MMVIHIEDNIFPGRHSGIFAGMLYALCLLAGYYLVVFVESCFGLSDSRYEGWVQLGVIAVCVIVICILISRRTKRTNGIMEMQAVFSDDGVELTVHRKMWKLSYEDIREIRKIMIMNRMYPDKGKYRVQIKKRMGGTLNFYTTPEEYANALDFEETELYQFYRMCQAHGMKCC